MSSALTTISQISKELLDIKIDRIKPEEIKIVVSDLDTYISISDRTLKEYEHKLDACKANYEINKRNVDQAEAKMHKYLEAELKQTEKEMINMKNKYMHLEKRLTSCVKRRRIEVENDEKNIARMEEDIQQQRNLTKKRRLNEEPSSSDVAETEK